MRSKVLVPRRSRRPRRPSRLVAPDRQAGAVEDGTPAQALDDAPARVPGDDAVHQEFASFARGRRRDGAISPRPITMSARVAVATASHQPGASRKYAGTSSTRTMTRA